MDKYNTYGHAHSNPYWPSQSEAYIIPIFQGKTSKFVKNDGFEIQLEIRQLKNVNKFGVVNVISLIKDLKSDRALNVET